MDTPTKEESVTSPKKVSRRGGKLRTKHIVVKNMRELGALVRRARQRLRMTQSDAALCCGVGRRFFIELENGKSTVQFDKVFLVLDMLGLELSIGGAGAQFTPTELSETCLKLEEHEKPHTWVAEFERTREVPFEEEEPEQKTRGRKTGTLSQQYRDEVNRVVNTEGEDMLQKEADDYRRKGKKGE